MESRLVRPIAEDNAEGIDAIHVVGATMRMMPFWPKKVALWFRQIEAQFALNKITKDEIKFEYVIAQLDTQYLEEVEDIVCNPPDQDKYEALKQEMIRRLSDSDTTRVRKLLETEEIGERTPSQFWRHLKELAGSAISEDFLLQLWKCRLPVGTQQVLAANSDKEGAKLVAIAARVHVIPKERGRIEAVSPPSEVECLREEVRELRREIAELAIGTRVRAGRSRERGRSPSRNRRPGSRDRHQRETSPQRLCWYHRTFASKACKCVIPCELPEN